MSKMRTVVGAAAEGERNVHCCGEAPPRGEIRRGWQDRAANKGPFVGADSATKTA